MWGSAWHNTEDSQRNPGDCPISDQAVLEARHVARMLRDFGDFGIIVSSPYLRCVQTAIAIADPGHAREGERERESRRRSRRRRRIRRRRRVDLFRFALPVRLHMSSRTGTFCWSSGCRVRDQKCSAVRVEVEGYRTIGAPQRRFKKKKKKTTKTKKKEKAKKEREVERDLGCERYVGSTPTPQPLQTQKKRRRSERKHDD